MQRVFCITQMGKVADRRLVFLRGICSGRGWKTDLGLRFVATATAAPGQVIMDRGTRKTT